MKICENIDACSWGILVIFCLIFLYKASFYSNEDHPKSKISPLLNSVLIVKKRPQLVVLRKIPVSSFNKSMNGILQDEQMGIYICVWDNDKRVC